MSVFATKLKPAALSYGIALALVCGAFAGEATAAELIARAAYAKLPVTVTGLATSSFYVAVKFADQSLVRVSNGNQVSAAAGTNATAIASVLSQHGLSLSPER